MDVKTIIKPQNVIELIASDAQSYPFLFKNYSSMLENYHGFKMNNYNNDETLFICNRDSSELERMDSIDYSYVISSRISSSRNIRGYSFSPSISSNDRLNLESLIISSLEKMKGEFTGYYYNLENLAPADEDFFITHHLLLTEPTSESINRDWPHGRGIFNNNSAEFAIWINGVDHLCLISQNVGGDISSVFEDWITAINGIEVCLLSNQLEFEQDSRLGYLTTSLCDVGSGFHSSMRIKLPNLSQQTRELHSKCDVLNLCAEKCFHRNNESDSYDNIWEISTRGTLGKSEVEITQQLIDGISQLISYEKSF